MKRIYYSLFILLSLVILQWTGCKKQDNPAEAPVENEHPPATTVTMYMVRLDSLGHETTDTTWTTVRDTSVVKGKDFTEGTLSLKPGTSYKTFFRLFDESQSPVEELTNDNISEKNAHNFLLAPSSSLSSQLTFTDYDLDDNGKVFGLNFTTKVASGVSSINGSINVILRHYDSLNKNDTQFDTDLDRDFSVTIIQ